MQSEVQNNPLGVEGGEAVTINGETKKILFINSQGDVTDYRLDTDETLRVIEDDDQLDVYLLSIYYDEDGHGGIPWGGSGKTIREACMGLDGGNPDILIVGDESDKETFRRKPHLSLTRHSSQETFAYQHEVTDEILFVEFDAKTKYTRMLIGRLIDPDCVTTF